MEELALRPADGPAIHSNRLQTLKAERQALVRIPAEAALARILDAAWPAAVVHSFEAQDLYLLIHDIGPDDALPLLALASDHQVEHILDRELWQRDELRYDNMTLWLQRLYAADPRRTLEWLLKNQPALLEMYLFRNVRLHIREHDQDPADLPPDAFTFDDVFYVELLPLSKSSRQPTEQQDRRDFFLSRFLEDLAIYDYTAYQQTLLNALHVLPAEAEEEAFRLRSNRLEELGFVPFETALEIYQPIQAATLNSHRHRKQPTRNAAVLSNLPAVPLYPLHLLDTAHLFGRALARIDNEAVLQQIQLEFAGLANQIIMADQQPLTSRSQLRQVVAKACGYLNIGMESLAPKNRQINLNQAVACIQRYNLAGLFRVGYGKALALKHQARKWLKTAWFRQNKLGLAFWDEDGMGRLGGLMLKKPMYYDNYQSGVRFREFNSLQDIITTRNALRHLMNLDMVFKRLAFRPPPSSEIPLTCKNTLLTLWARHCLNLTTWQLLPLGLADLRRFLQDLFVFPPATPGRPHIPLTMKTMFLQWLAEGVQLPAEELSDLLAPVLEALFTELEQELGNVLPQNLDARYIQLFLVSPVHAPSQTRE